MRESSQVVVDKLFGEFSVVDLFQWVGTLGNRKRRRFPTSSPE